jgi:hypothetical protein
MALNLEGLSAICPFYRYIAQKKTLVLSTDTTALGRFGGGQLQKRSITHSETEMDREC